MKQKVKQKIKQANYGTCLLLILLLIISSAISYKKAEQQRSTTYEEQARIKLSGLQNKIENGMYEKSKYPYLVYDLSGTVTYVNGSLLASKYRKGDHVMPLEKIEALGEAYYEKTAAVIKNGTLVATAVFYINKNQFDHKTSSEIGFEIMLPIWIGILLSILVIVYRSFYLNHKVLGPIIEISKSTKAILNGNYDIEVQRVYGEHLKDDEIGELTYSFELMRDELKERVLREEELTKASRELISSISHDLRTPIATIQAYSEGIRDGIATTENEREEYVGVIIKKTHLLTDMIRELLEYSNATLNHFEMNKKELYFKQYFNDLMRELKPYVERAGVDFSFEPLDDDALVVMDAKRLTEVIYNLVENSLKYKKGNDDQIKVMCEITQGEIKVTVKDNGVGISAEDIPHVFDQFYRAEKSRNLDVKGSGLGLSICKYIVEQHGGQIGCMSRKGKGCEIWFTIEI